MEIILRFVIRCLLFVLFGNRTKATPLSSKNIRKVLIFRYDRIGDMVLTTPVLELLRINMPQAEIHVLASPANAPILRCDERISSVYRYRKDLRTLWHLRKQIRYEQFDVVLCLVFNKTWDGFLAQWLCGSEALRITVAHESRIRFYEPLYDVQSPRLEAKSLAELQMCVVKYAFGWDTKLLPLSLRICPKAVNRQHQYVKKVVGDCPVLLINCSAGSPERSLSSDLVISFVSQIQRFDTTLCFMVIAIPSESTLVEKICTQLPFVHRVPILDDIQDVCALVQEASWLITPDTAFVHFATAVQTPLVGLYQANASKDKLFIPVGVRNEIVYANQGENITDIDTKEIRNAFIRLRENPNTPI